MDLQLKGKSALITGSASGIGYAIAKMLGQEGARVIINGRSEESVIKALDQLRTEVPSIDVSGIAADFSSRESSSVILDKIGTVDILVNNVGIFTSQSFSNTSDEDWYRLFEVNVMSGVRLSRALLPQMLSRNWGRIIFISSECAQLVPNDLIAYSTTKAALHAVSRGLAQITGGTGVTVNTVMPGSTLSDGAKRFLKEQAEKDNTTTEEAQASFFRNVRTTSLLQRFASTDEVAAAVVYLASPLSAATNGAVLHADGGSVTGIF